MGLTRISALDLIPMVPNGRSRSTPPNRKDAEPPLAITRRRIMFPPSQLQTKLQYDRALSNEVYRLFAFRGRTQIWIFRSEEQ
jgi:hypothetical protein